jgi:hypothetical protein
MALLRFGFAGGPRQTTAAATATPALIIKQSLVSAAVIFAALRGLL